MAYKSTLLSSLVTIRYEDSINTLNDMVNSGMPLMIPRYTAPHKRIASDPRKIMMKIFNSSHLYPFNGTVPAYVWDM